ncbi:MAG: DUF2188 domain-containing protein [Candidatus Atribacteria bacterium]|nr:DUF2188 domain-containing protein [Candidatus Atribacteria bacterium]
MSKRKRIMVHHGDDPKKPWEVREEGSKEPLKTTTTKDKAVQVGRKIAKGTGNSQLVIFKKDGKIQEERTYVGDPYPPKG